ncbi:MAG: imidazole glycerol phosphate synthase subunit HisH [Chthoniobacterales bacterium]|nr:imidazole glycerol phosphate synthase subunit HisH [Chthoniobacterales bacterium]
MTPRVAVIDYGSGNLRSVEKALQKAGAEPVRCADADRIAGCDAIVLPGVGSFGDCARSLEERGLTPALRDWLAADRPYLGICLGYQILFEASAESPDARGLGHWGGRAVKFQEAPGHKVPHMGWNSLAWGAQDEIFAGVADGAYVFFVHSFYPAPTDESSVTAWCDYGVKFAAAAARGRVHGVQFHPEKSQDVGLRILENFVQSVRETK